MHIGIDASNLRAGGGVTHLAELLAAAEPSRHGIERIVVWGGKSTLDRLPTAPWLALVHEPALDAGLPRRLRWQRFELERQARAACDLLFTPGGQYSGRFRPFVTMSRNLLPFEPHERWRYGASWMLMKLVLLRAAQSSTFRRADGVVFLNEYARDAVLAVTGPLPGRTAIVPHGVGATFMRAPRHQAGPEVYRRDRPFRLLYVSTVDVYKHQWHVVEATAALHARGLPIALDLVGSAYEPALARLRDAMASVDPDRRFVRYAGPEAHAALPARYHQADAFVFASSCENMPNILLEAMAAGLPIACADRGPMPSVLADAGLYFDPETPSTVTDSLERLYHDPDLRGELAARAHRRAQAFSWERCSRETLSFLVEARTSSGARSETRPAEYHQG